MKPAHTTARLLRDLKRHVKTVNKGSEPFASGLKSIEATAWSMLLLRGIEWPVIGTRTTYAYSVHTYVSTPEGLEETHVTPARTPKPVTFNAYQRGVRRMAAKVLAQYERTATWVSQRYADALNDDSLNGRTRLRCLTGHAAFDALVKSRFREIEAMVAGRRDTETENRMAEFVNRHGQVHVYRDNLYSSSAEARKALREDTEAIPADHDYIVDLFERAFPPEGYVEDIYEELVRYMRSQDHRDALAFSKEMGGRTGSLKRHDQIVKMVANAQHKLAALDDPLPERLYDKLGVSKSYLTKLMTGKERNKAMIREALREAMYQLCPSKRPRKRRAQIAAVEASTLPPSMAQCAPGCQCIRHQA